MKKILCNECEQELTNDQAELCEFCKKFYCEQHIDKNKHGCVQKPLF